MPSNPTPTGHILRVLPFLCAVFPAPCGAVAPTPYLFGNPTAEEQSYIELINRARANPTEEGKRLADTTDPAILNAYSQYRVNLAMMKAEFAAIAASPPVAPNASLTTAARGHTAWMLATATQSHYQPTNSPDTRIEAAGYDWWIYGENIYAYSSGVWFGHAGFQVDWGPGGTGGMQTPRGHRTTIHNPNFREIGVGIVNGSNGAVGPQLVTQDFGEPWDTQSFGTGVAYYDLNANSFYDIGEGISGLTVNVSGAAYSCTTAIGGGWAFPIPDTAATRNTTFVGLGINQTRSLVVPVLLNAKIDLKLSYAPPTITSPASVTLGNPLAFGFTAVGGATGYKWNRWNSTAAAAENCESLAEVTATTTGGYPVLNSAVKSQGSSSFHLVYSGTPGNQTLELKSLYHGLTAPSLSFDSRLLISTADQHYRVQVKEEGSAIWQDVYNQDGGTPEAAFTTKTVLLPTMAGKEFRIRFVLNFVSGTTWTSTGDGYGWFIDAITLTNTTSLTNHVSQTLAGTSGSFTPAVGNYLLSVAPVISGIEFPNTDQSFSVTAPAPTFANWAASFETANSLTAGTLANNPNADPDKDGRANLIEYAFGTSPVAANEATPNHPARQASATHLVIRYVRNTNLADLLLVPVASSNLVSWKSPSDLGAPAGFTDSVVSTAANLETREAKIPRGSSGMFLRMRVTRP